MTAVPRQDVDAALRELRDAAKDLDDAKSAAGAIVSFTRAGSAPDAETVLELIGAIYACATALQGAVDRLGGSEVQS